MKNKLSKAEIKKKLKWFHGEEFEKYPFIDEDPGSLSDDQKKEQTLGC